MKKLIQQYVNTGNKLPSEQVTKLPNWAKKTYFKRRLIAVDDGRYSSAEFGLIRDGEEDVYFTYKYQSLSTKEEIIDAINSTYRTFKDIYVYKNLSDEWKIKYINLVISKNDEFKDKMYLMSSDNVKKHYRDIVINEGLPVSLDFFWDLFPDLKWGYNELQIKQVKLYYNSLIKNKRYKEWRWFTGGTEKNYNSVFSNEFDISEYSEEIAIKFADMVIDQVNKKGGFIMPRFKNKYYEITGNSIVKDGEKYVRRKGKVLAREGLLGEEVNSYLNQNQTAEYLKLKNKKWVKIRAGLPRTNNDKEIVNSKGRRHGDIIKEEGVSYFEAIYSHNNGWLLIMNAIADYYEVAGKRPFYLIEGESIGKEGLSGEDLLDPNTVKVIGELNPDKIVEGNDLTTASGNEIDIRSMYKAGLLIPGFRGFEALPSDESKLIYYSY